METVGIDIKGKINGDLFVIPVGSYCRGTHVFEQFHQVKEFRRWRRGWRGTWRWRGLCRRSLQRSDDVLINITDTRSDHGEVADVLEWREWRPGIDRRKVIGFQHADRFLVHGVSIQC